MNPNPNKETPEQELRQDLSEIIFDHSYQVLNSFQQMRIDEVVKYFATHYKARQAVTVSGKQIEFQHTAVSKAMHLFIDGDHNPRICPECLQPGILTPNEETN